MKWTLSMAIYEMRNIRSTTQIIESDNTYSLGNRIMWRDASHIPCGLHAAGRSTHEARDLVERNDRQAREAKEAKEAKEANEANEAKRRKRRRGSETEKPNRRGKRRSEGIEPKKTRGQRDPHWRRTTWRFREGHSATPRIVASTCRGGSVRGPPEADSSSFPYPDPP